MRRHRVLLIVGLALVLYAALALAAIYLIPCLLFVGP